MKKLTPRELAVHLQSILQQTKTFFNRSGSRKVWDVALKIFYIELNKNGIAIIKIRNGIYLKVTTGRSFPYHVDLQMTDFDIAKSQAWRQKLTINHKGAAFFDTDCIEEKQSSVRQVNDGAHVLMEYFSEASSESLEMAGLEMSSDDDAFLLIKECPLCLEKICQCGECLSLLEIDEVASGDGCCPNCGVEFKKQAN